MREEMARILVVEDDPLIAMAVAQMVEECGCDVIGPAAQLDDALMMAKESELEGAVLDIDLGTERVWPLARLLRAAQVPIILATGFSSAEVPEEFWNAPLLPKPVRKSQLRNALLAAGIIRVETNPGGAHSNY